MKLEEIQKTNSKFVKLVKVCESDPRCRGLFLNSFLIKPTQRIMKYPLLLSDIIKNTPEDHSDLESLESSFEQIKILLDTINERKRNQEATTKLIEINTKMDGCDIEILGPSRKLLKQGILETISKGKRQNALAFLFNDLMLVVRERKGRYEYRSHYYLDDCKLILVGNTEGTFHY